MTFFFGLSSVSAVVLHFYNYAPDVQNFVPNSLQLYIEHTKNHFVHDSIKILCLNEIIVRLYYLVSSIV